MDRLTASEVFVAIAERSSLSAAADALGMSRAMVSRHLVDMECWVGVRLLNRTTRSISLTPGGEEALRRCRDMLSHARQLAQSRPVDSHPLRGQIRMSCSHSLGQATLAAAVSAFHRDHPDVGVALAVDNRALHLVDDRVDLAVRIHSGLDGSLVARPLGVCMSVLCASPNYLARRGMPRAPADLLHHDCAVYAPLGLSSWRLRARQDEAAVDVPIRSHLCADDSLFLLAAALDDGGITMQPYLSVAKHLEAGQLVQVLPDFEPPALDVCAIYATRAHMAPQVRAMLDHLVAWFERPAVKALLLGTGPATARPAPRPESARPTAGLARHALRP
ncbi:LysR family transcriptional regulator [Variovorax sp. KK3]|uniref:LysR family transcriptional regulator n=1 Tax=Variovorax sp. KK3 TaxID=1855728 RepID=UPI00097C49B6|nr:LysR family transcriptional regulator [Variovorax sp. KK3]